MKYLLLFFLAFSLTLSVSAQSPSGKVVYEQKTNMHRRMKDATEEIKAMIPEFQTVQKELLFSGSKTLYRTLKAEDMEMESESDGTRMQIRMTMPEEFFFRDYAASRKTEQREFLGRKFLIKDAIEPMAWKVTGEQKMINDYPCMKAVMSLEEERQEIEAWFTPTIPVMAGPGEFAQLPGLVMLVSINDGEVVYTATTVEIKDIAPDLLTEPTEGKEVSQAEYDTIVEEKMKEMGGNKGGAVFRIIKTN